LVTFDAEQIKRVKYYINQFKQSTNNTLMRNYRTKQEPAGTEIWIWKTHLQQERGHRGWTRMNVVLPLN